MSECPFCNIRPEEIILSSEYCYAIYDKYPVSEGHILVIPEEHEPDYFNLPEAVKFDIIRLSEKVKDFLQKKYSPDGFNVGINIGKAAGQTIFHCHVHIIPRYFDDVKDPTGGVRGVIFSRQKY